MEQQRIPLLLVLGIIVFFIWDAWMTDYVRQSNTATQTTQVSELSQPSLTSESPTIQAASSSSEQGSIPSIKNEAVINKGVVNVKTNVLDLDISLQGGSVIRADLLNYPVDSKQKDKLVRLLDNRTHFKYLAQSGLQSKTESVSFNTDFTASVKSLNVTENTESLVLAHTVNGITFEKIFTFEADSYLIKVDHKVNNNSNDIWTGHQYRQLAQNQRARESRLLYTYTGGVYSGAIPNSSEDIPYERVSFEDMAENNLSQELSGGWIGMIQHYFLTSWIPTNQEENNLFYSRVTNKESTPLYALGLSSSTKTIEPSKSGVFESQLYIGPKLHDDLAEIAPNLELTLDFGIWSIFSEPIFWVLKQIQNVVANWGWSIIFLTILIKLLFFYPSSMSYRSMANMRKVAPKLQSLKERYGDDRQRMGQEMMKLYKEEKINPAGGCLPILLQIPVFIALYWVLLESVELRQASWMLWYQDLSKPDPYFVLPILMGVSMFIQQKLNPPPTDEMQRKIFQFMPWVFMVFFAFFPAGLVLYWVVNNVFSIAHQWWITRRITTA